MLRSSLSTLREWWRQASLHPGKSPAWKVLCCLGVIADSVVSLSLNMMWFFCGYKDAGLQRRRKRIPCFCPAFQFHILRFQKISNLSTSFVKYLWLREQDSNQWDMVQRIFLCYSVKWCEENNWNILVHGSLKGITVVFGLRFSKLVCSSFWYSVHTSVQVSTLEWSLRTLGLSGGRIKNSVLSLPLQFWSSAQNTLLNLCPEVLSPASRFFGLMP